MRIDAYTHFFPKKFFDKMTEIAGDYKDMGKRVRALPALFDIDHRKKMVDMYPDYVQILSYPQPPLERLAKGAAIDELVRLINDGFAELCAKERDHFPGWVAQVSFEQPEAGAREAERAIKELGALGVQIYTNVAGKPVDLPEYAPFWAKMNELGKPVWIHPARGAETPDYPLHEKKSLYEIWWGLGWSYETACTMSRLVWSKIIDNHPNLKLLVHHFGGIVPMLEGRLGPGWDVMGSRTTEEDYVSLRKSLKKRPLDYFKQDFYADTAVFTARAATICGLDFYPIDKVVFASDCPFDPEGGTMYIRETLKILDSLPLSKTDRDKIYFKNFEAMCGVKLVK
jgi:predicted TIM-barrel fold metal-dependent hydrolase